jgi:hypothetical protein
MPPYAWAALGVCIVSTAGGAAFAGMRALQTWRDLRRLRRALADRLGELSRGVFGVETRVGRLESSVGRIAVARAQLQESLAAAAVTAAAAGDAGAALRVLGYLRR